MMTVSRYRIYYDYIDYDDDGNLLDSCKGLEMEFDDYDEAMNSLKELRMNERHENVQMIGVDYD